jgi:hypothetical protein
MPDKEAVADPFGFGLQIVTGLTFVKDKLGGTILGGKKVVCVVEHFVTVFVTTTV